MNRVAHKIALSFVRRAFKKDPPRNKREMLDALEEYIYQDYENMTKQQLVVGICDDLWARWDRMSAAEIAQDEWCKKLPVVPDDRIEGMGQMYDLVMEHYGRMPRERLLQIYWEAHHPMRWWGGLMEDAIREQELYNMMIEEIWPG